MNKNRESQHCMNTFTDWWIDNQKKSTLVNDSVIIFPETEELKKEVKKLHDEVFRMILKRDELMYQKCRKIEMIYLLEFGEVECQVDEAQYMMFRLKRKIEIIEGLKKQRKKVSFSHLEEILDREFNEDQKKLDERKEKIKQVNRCSHDKRLNEKDYEELNALYKNIVEVLHPEIEPDLDDAKRQIFEKALLAYKKRDLKTLRSIEKTVNKPVIKVLEKDKMFALLQEKKRLFEKLRVIHDSMKKMKTEYPYVLKDYVTDPQKMKVRKEVLESDLQQNKKEIEFYTRRIIEIYARRMRELLS